MRLLPLIIYIAVLGILFIIVIIYEIVICIKGLIINIKKFKEKFKSCKVDTEEEIIYVDTFERVDTSKKDDF